VRRFISTVRTFLIYGYKGNHNFQFSILNSQFHKTWLDFARRYKQMAVETRNNHFPVRRLEAYAAWNDRDPSRMKSTWEALWGVADNDLLLSGKSHTVLPPEVPAPIAELPGVSTNNAALWSLDAIYILEVFP
jgi:hypothetical protein